MFYQWQCGRFLLNLDNPKVMGIVNLTPDSFSDGGAYSKTFQMALAHAEQLLKDGADILDIGGESTRPNANHISSAEEWARVEPVLKEVMKWNIPVSLDTRHTLVMKQALDRGIDIINDVAALSDDGAVNLLASYHQVGICLMHMKGTPKNMQQQPHYDDVVSEVINYLKNRVTVCTDAGISRNRLVIDPGFGFGKTLSHNIELMQYLGDFLKEINLPLLIGVSRKRMIGELSGEKNISMRVFGSVAAALASVSRGAQIVRVHDVKATVEALNVWKAIGIFE